MIFETKRLYLREMTQNDFKNLSDILQDKDVVYAYEHDFTDEDVQEWLDRQLIRYKKYGFGLWAVVLKENNEMIGQAGITIQTCESEELPEIGYLFKKKYWHKGYAHESAKGCMEYAFNKLHMDKIYSIIKSDNLPSIKVAKSIGMTKEKEFITKYYNGDMKHYLFSANKKLL